MNLYLVFFIFIIFNFCFQNYEVGIAPGDFAFWSSCSYDGDINLEELLADADDLVE